MSVARRGTLQTFGGHGDLFSVFQRIMFSPVAPPPSLFPSQHGGRPDCAVPIKKGKGQPLQSPPMLRVLHLSQQIRFSQRAGAHHILSLAPLSKAPSFPCFCCPPLQPRLVFMGRQEGVCAGEVRVSMALSTPVLMPTVKHGGWLPFLGRLKSSHRLCGQQGGFPGLQSQYDLSNPLIPLKENRQASGKEGRGREVSR